MWISNAKEAGIFLVFANQPELGYKESRVLYLIRMKLKELKLGKRSKGNTFIDVWRQNYLLCIYLSLCACSWD